MNYAQQHRQRQPTTIAITTFSAINTLDKVQDGKVSIQNPSNLMFIRPELLLTTLSLFLFFSILEENQEGSTPPASFAPTDVTTAGLISHSRRGSSEPPSSLLPLVVLLTLRESSSKKLASRPNSQTPLSENV